MTDTSAPVTEELETPTNDVNDGPTEEPTNETPTAGQPSLDEVFGQVARQPVSPEASPNGAWLAYLLPSKESGHELWLSPTDGGEPVQLDIPFTPVVDRDPDSGRIVRGPQWSPDNTVLALAGTSDGSVGSALWLVPVPGAVATPVLTPEPSSEPEPVETPIAEGEAEPVEASAEDAGEEPSASESTEETTETETAEEASEAAPTTELVAAANSDWKLELDGPTQLTAPAGLDSDRSPRWANDGQAIAFVATRDRRDVIGLVSVAESFPAPAGLLTWSGLDDREPMWSRDGQFLAFTRSRIEGLEHNDIYVYNTRTGELKNLTGEKTTAIRHSLEWVPGRNLVAYVTVENDWLAIHVINADNKAGWTVTRETGDKTEPRFAPNEARLLYIRTEGFSTVCCERGLHASNAIALDPGEGVVTSPRWIGPKRVVYGFSAPQKPVGFLVQNNTADAEREGLQLPGEFSTAGAKLKSPVPFEYELGPDEHFSGMIYRTHGLSGKSPAAIYIPDGPLHARRGEFQAEEQALASTGISILTPVMHGATGFGEALAGDLAAFADTELESSDIAESGRSLAAINDIEEKKVAVVGNGYGGTLALVTAGARPGTFAAVAAVDPIVEWATELADTPTAWRNWVVAQYGLPFVHQDRYALRSPITFGAVINVPIILVTTSQASTARREQMDLFKEFLDEEGIAYTYREAAEEPLALTLRKVSQDLAKLFFEGRDTGTVVEGVRADEIDE